MSPLSFEEYLQSLRQLTPVSNPLSETERTDSIRTAARGLKGLHEISIASLARWVQQNSNSTNVLFLTVGLSSEKTKNILKDKFGTSGALTLARTRPNELVTMLDEEFDLVRLLKVQRDKEYSFEDILIARAGARAVAVEAGRSGRRVEDKIEELVVELGLRYSVRTKFEGVRGAKAPCDIAIPGMGRMAQIVVAAKGFDSTGSKLTDAVREVEEMANVRRPDQYVFAVIDGIGWKSRQADLRRIFGLWESRAIAGCYTLETFGEFRASLTQAARLSGLLN